jgi:polyisoprenoid-binding protein YceI
MKANFFYYFFILLSITGCTKQPKSDMAKISDPEQVQPLGEGERFVIDTATSIITWVGTKPTGRHNGIFKIKEGFITVIKNDSQQVNENNRQFIGQIKHAQIIIDISSVDILDLKHNPLQYDKLLKHLKSKDFFQTDKFPIATFELTFCEKIEKDSIVRESNEFTLIDPTHMVRGNFTLKGNTKSIEFPVRLDMRNLKVEVSAKFNIDRTAWNINYLNENDAVAKAKDSFINNIVNIGFEILAFSQNP